MRFDDDDDDLESGTQNRLQPINVPNKVEMKPGGDDDGENYDMESGSEL